MGTWSSNVYIFRQGRPKYLYQAPINTINYANTILRGWRNFIKLSKRNELFVYESNEDNVYELKKDIQLKPDNLTISNCQRSGNSVSHYQKRLPW